MSVLNLINITKLQPTTSTRTFLYIISIEKFSDVTYMRG